MIINNTQNYQRALPKAPKNNIEIIIPKRLDFVTIFNKFSTPKSPKQREKIDPEADATLEPILASFFSILVGFASKLDPYGGPGGE